MCSLAAEVKLLPQFHTQLMLLKLVNLGGVIFHQVAPDTVKTGKDFASKNRKGFCKSENKRLHMLSLCKVNFKLIASS